MPVPPAHLLSTFQSLLSTFSSFLTVSIHTILYQRGIYPPESFVLTRAYNFPVRQSRDPKVCEWINDAVAAVEAQLLKGVVERVAVVIYSSQALVLERFVFDVGRFPSVPVEERLTPFSQTGEVGTVSCSVNIVDVEEQLRAATRSLAYSGGKLGVLPSDCTFTVAMELKEGGEPPLEVFPVVST
jgi:mitotic spindle assembly checkpoint protein MAD2B